MFCWHWSALLAFVLLLHSPSQADHLRPEQINIAAHGKEIRVPSPVELFTALGKVSDWQSLYRKPIPTNFTSRPQIALNLGGLLADGYLAGTAEDSQQVKNIGKDILALSKSLGMSDSLLRRIGSTMDATKSQSLCQQVEATQREITAAMQEMQDADLIPLVTVGTWLRATEATANWVAQNYNPTSAKVLRQPDVAAFFSQKLQELPEKIREDKIVDTTAKGLQGLRQSMDTPHNAAPSVEQVRALQSATQELVKNVSDRK